jgi:hypothetical protein
MFWDKQGGCKTCRRLTHNDKYDSRYFVMNYERGLGVYRCTECRTFWEIGSEGAVWISEAEAVELAAGAPLPG